MKKDELTNNDPRNTAQERKRITGQYPKRSCLRFVV